MIRRILAIVLIVLGLGTIGAAIASATVWKPDSTVTVPLPSEPEVNYVISEPGVLNIVNKTVKVRAVAQDGESPVFLGMGRTEDVEAWVAESDHGAITGLPTWDSLGYQKIDGVEPEAEDEDGEEAAEEEEPEAANPADSDMWVEQVNGVGELTYTWEEVPGQWSMIVATDGASPAPMVEFTWEREVPTPALIPGILVGSVLTILGFVLLTLDVLARRKVRAVAAEAGVDDDVDAEEPTPADELEVAGADPEETSPDETSPEETSPEEIMAGVEAATQEPEPLIATTEFEYVKAPEAPATEEYPHRLESDAPEEEDRPLTRREIRERERARERAAALGLDSGDEAAELPEMWPVQEAQEPAPAEPEVSEAPPAAKKRRRWWRRKQTPPPASAPGPIVLDDDTGEIIITGEIDLSSLNPQASGASWRATWGLDSDTPTRWIPVMKPTHGGEDNDEE